MSSYVTVERTTTKLARIVLWNDQHSIERITETEPTRLGFFEAIGDLDAHGAGIAVARQETIVYPDALSLAEVVEIHWENLSQR